MTSLRRLIFIAMCVTVLVVQKQMLMILPNIQFTVLLLVLFASIFTFRETLAIVFVYVMLDGMLVQFNPFYLLPMLIGWSLIPVFYHTVLRCTKHDVTLAVFGFVFSFIYGWVFIPFVMVQIGLDEFWPYLLADLPFEFVMGVSSFLTILWLYNPLYRVLRLGMRHIETHWETVRGKL